jgi:hypothetical protein
MIKTLSPYNITIPYLSPLTGLVCTEFTMKLYIWKGLKTAIPVTASYEITKSNPELLETSTKINIANLINPFLSFVPVLVTDTDFVDSTNQTWYSISVFYTTSNVTEVNTPQLQETKLAVKGYSYGMEGENAETPANKVLIQAREFKVSSDSKITIPIELTETTPPTAEIVITAVDLIAGEQYDVTFTSVGTYTTFYAIITPDVGDAVIVLMSDITSPQEITITFTGDVDVQMFGYDSATATTIYSNIFSITI